MIAMCLKSSPVHICLCIEFPSVTTPYSMLFIFTKQSKKKEFSRVHLTVNSSKMRYVVGFEMSFVTGRMIKVLL